MQILYDINFAGVVIGFDPNRDVFSEESGRGQFTVRVITGSLDSNVTVLLSTASCVADSKYCYVYTIHVSSMPKMSQCESMNDNYNYISALL